MELTLGFPEPGSGNPKVSSTNPPVLRGWRVVTRLLWANNFPSLLQNVGTHAKKTSYLI
eukprot:COSAG02_NODE_753_length_17610_cov_23.119753_18_plen_59_part_00